MSATGQELCWAVGLVLTAVGVCHPHYILALRWLALFSLWVHILVAGPGSHKSCSLSSYPGGCQALQVLGMCEPHALEEPVRNETISSPKAFTV